MEKYMNEEKELNLRDIINIFLRRINIFFIFSIPVFIFIILFQSLKPYKPIYLATFDIGISEEKPVERFFTAGEEALTTQIGTVTQRVISNLLSLNLAEKIVDTLSLYAFIKNGNKDLKIKTEIKEDFENILGPFKIKIDDEKIYLFEQNRQIFEGNIKDYIDIGCLKFKILPLKDINKKIFSLTFYPKKKVAISLRNSISIKVLEADKIEKGVKGGVPFSGEEGVKKIVTAKTIFPGLNLIGVLRIDVYWADPEIALEISKILSELVIKEDIREKSLTFIKSREFIQSQLSFYEQNLKELEERIRRFREIKKIADLKISTQNLISQVSQIESRKNQLEIEEKILRDLNEYLAKKEEGENPGFAITLLSNPILQNLYTQLLNLEGELKGLLKEYAPSHPRVLETKSKIEGLKEQIKEESLKRLSSIKTEIQSVSNQIKSLQKELENIPKDEIELARLERDKETAEKLYTFFAEKLEETKIKEAGVTSNLKIINPPVLSPGPVNAKKPFLNLILALIISFLSGIFAVYLSESIDHTVKDVDLLKAKTQLPIFASIPLVGSNKKRLTEIFKREKLLEELKIISYDSSADFEAFRKLAINIQFAHPEKKYKVIYITSPGPEEGKSFVTLNLASAFAQTGKKVIILDTDFRKKKGHLASIIEPEKEKGLFNILKDEIDLKSVITSFPLNSTDSISLIPVGEIPPNPFIFLESEKMRKLIEELKKEYDYLIIDGVPVLLFADATYLSKYADGVILVVRYGKTNYREIEDTRDILISSNSNIIGLVLNAIPKKRGSHYYYYYKYYNKYYGKEKE
ncbi:MAG: polysaccharide biosynthesis tyrosine autokinase [candidate division WOR-3 bacterium]